MIVILSKVLYKTLPEFNQMGLTLKEAETTIQKLQRIFGFSRHEICIILLLARKNSRKTGLSFNQLLELLPLNKKEINLYLENLKSRGYLVVEEGIPEKRFRITDLVLKDFHTFLSEYLKEQNKKIVGELFHINPYTERIILY